MVLVVAHRPSSPGLKSWSARRSSPTGTTSPDSRTIASITDAFHRYEMALGSGWRVIWLASSHSPYMWVACIRSWKSASTGVCVCWLMTASSWLDEWYPGDGNAGVGLASLFGRGDPALALRQDDRRGADAIEARVVHVGGDHAVLAQRAGRVEQVAAHPDHHRVG